MSAESLRSAGNPDEEEVVDLDLDLTSDKLRRESVGEPTTVRIGGVVIHISHASDWSSTAMRAANAGNWEVWAREVIENDTEYEAWVEADLRNYQVEAVFSECGQHANISSGKSSRPSGSRKNSRRR